MQHCLIIYSYFAITQEQKMQLGTNKQTNKPRNKATVSWETFKGENLSKFQGFVAIHKSFLC